MEIRIYQSEDEAAVIELWRRCGLVRPWNNPRQDIERKLKVQSEMFLVGLIEGKIVASVMGGYDGHRGWVYYLAVDPDHQRQSLGREIMAAIEEKIRVMGAPKINLQSRTDNLAATRFYESIGYKTDAVASMGKRLVDDEKF
jgi:ribosomal protein S18 acetylase RimI-like enzyme